jgi:membrane protease YdiL (CAAX protease family)
MRENPDPLPRAVPAAVLIHQEGVVGVLALVGLSLRAEGIVGGLEPRGLITASVFSGLATGVVCAAAMWGLRRLPAVAALEKWQRHMVRGWSITDAVAVAFFSGLAEEALIRALLQPLIGLLPAAVIFAALHFVPDRRLWLWPVLACLLGVILGVVFDFWGYPAAAAAHVAINAVALLRMQPEAAE